MRYDILYGHISTVDRDITPQRITVINRANESLLQYAVLHRSLRP